MGHTTETRAQTRCGGYSSRKSRTEEMPAKLLTGASDTLFSTTPNKTPDVYEYRFRATSSPVSLPYSQQPAKGGNHGHGLCPQRTGCAHPTPPRPLREPPQKKFKIAPKRPLPPWPTSSILRGGGSGLRGGKTAPHRPTRPDPTPARAPLTAYPQPLLPAARSVTAPPPPYQRGCWEL